MKEEPQKKQRIAVWMAVCLFVTALGIEGFQALLDFVGIGLFINWAINPAVYFLFILWFWLLDVTFVKNPTRLAVMATAAIISLIPGINTLPEFTLAVLTTIVTVWIEDGNAIIGNIVNRFKKN